MTQKNPLDNNPLGRLQKASLENSFHSLEALGVRLDEVVSEEASVIKKGLPTLAIFATVAPLLGLLGTVTGMIETFQSITLYGAGDPKLMSGGISQALITTQLGLTVAIPLMLFHSFLKGRGNRIIETLEQQSGLILSKYDLTG